MTLREYLHKAGLTAHEFADRLSVSKSGVGKWLRGERIPRAAQIIEIQRVTGGHVTPADWYSQGKTVDTGGRAVSGRSGEFSQ